MHTEYEVRVLDIDKDKIIKKLEELGAQKIADFDYKEEFTILLQQFHINGLD